MRFLLLELLLLVTPFLIYRAYVLYVVRKKAEKGLSWNEGPITWEVIAGIVLAIIGLVTWGLTADRYGKGPYTPATYQDGVITPGSIEDTPERQGK